MEFLLCSQIAAAVIGLAQLTTGGHFFKNDIIYEIKTTTTTTTIDTAARTTSS